MRVVHWKKMSGSNECRKVPIPQVIKFPIFPFCDDSGATDVIILIITHYALIWFSNKLRH